MSHTDNTLFNLAINRANIFVLRAGIAKLPEWHARTRFAVRVPLQNILSALEKKPIGNVVWQGGKNGNWQPTKVLKEQE